MKGKWKFALVVGAVAAAVSASSAAAEPNLCVAANGQERVQKGTATCEATGQGSVAIAMGDGSRADADLSEFGDQVDHNKAKATGEGSFAQAGNGNGNTATASGDGSFASAGAGDNNVSTASGDGSFAASGIGDDNDATASGDGSVAFADNGSGNTATASGDGGDARAGVGDNNTATASADCDAFAIGGDQTVSCP